jgi:hypothetical protein
MAQPDAKQMCRWWEEEKTRRALFDTHWEDAARYVWPNQQDFVTTQRSPGEKRNLDIFDDTATENSKRYAAVMEALLTRRSTRWHRIQASEKELRKSASVRDYFQQVEELLFKERESQGANAYGACAQAYRSLGVFGNDGLFIDTRFEQGEPVGIRYKALDLRDLWVSRDWQDQPAVIFRRYELPVSQLAEKFGPERIPSHLMEKATQHPFDRAELLTVLYRNPEHQPASVFSKMWLAVEILTTDKVTVSDGRGYAELPVIFSRAEVAPGETYGRGPAMDVLPTIKTLNEMVKTMIRAAHKVADPPLLVANDGVLGVTQAVRLRAGALTRGGLSIAGQELVKPLYTGGNVGINMETLQYFTQKLDRAFLVDLFTLLVEKPQMTAAEILERANEKGMFLGPIIGGQQSEKLAPMIEREIGLLARMGRLPEPPEELIEAGGEYVLEYETPAAQLQRAGQVQTIESWLLSLQALGQVDPGVLEVADLEAAARRLGELRGVPAELIRDPREVAMRRQAQLQKAQEQEALEALPVVAKGVKDLASIPATAGTA